MAVAAVGIGSNLGEPEANCRGAIHFLQESTDFEVLRVSSLYRSEPVGVRSQPWFVNAVALVRTELEPLEMLRALKRQERAMGRRPGPRWGPRLLDLDLLLYDDRVYQDPELQVPHPRLAERRFVLVPLVEIDPSGRLPGTGVSFAALLSGLGEEQRVEMISESRSRGV